MTTCDSLVQTTVRPLLRLRAKLLLRRVLDTTGNAVSPLLAAHWPEVLCAQCGFTLVPVARAAAGL